MRFQGDLHAPTTREGLISRTRDEWCESGASFDRVYHRCGSLCGVALCFGIVDHDDGRECSSLYVTVFLEQAVCQDVQRLEFIK